MLLAITYDNLKMLERMLEFDEANNKSGNRGRGNGWNRIRSNDDVKGHYPEIYIDSEEFPRFMTPLMLATQCSLYETVEYLVNRGHKLDRPHPPRCTCSDQCVAAATRGDVVADSSERLNGYWSISDPTFMCTTSSSSDPVLECFRLYEELLQCGSTEQVHKTTYTQMATQVRQFAVEMIVNCRTSDEVKIMLRNRDGCRFRGKFPYPRLITAMDYKQKEFVAHTNIQQVLETAWLGDWIEWKSYSATWKLLYLLRRFIMLPAMVILGMLAPNSKMNQFNRLPINRMFNSLVTYLVFLWLLFRQSNADKFETRRGAPELGMLLPIAVFVVGHVLEKLKLRLQQGPERFFKNLWNVFDTVKLTLFSLAFLSWIAAALNIITQGSDDLDRKYWPWIDPQLVAESLFTMATVMAYLRLLFLCQLNYYIGPMQVSLGKVLHDFGKFATFLLIIMAAFTCGLGTYYSYYAGMVHKDPETGETTRQEDSFITVADTFKTLFWGIFCMTSLEAPNVVVTNTVAATGHIDAATQSHQFTQLVGYGLFAVFEVLMVVVMMNMLIASMSDTFQGVTDNAEYEWLFGRTQVYVSYMLLNDMPPPFNLLPTTGLLFCAKRLVSNSSHGYSRMPGDDGRGDLDSRSTAEDPEFRNLMTEIIKRYFTMRRPLVER
ncbi:short transient receptor potential channel 6-like [Acyrthosiphon pisum]|uniref:Transient receptor ion channel domain-containing protein n=1 Tax=Acyrthosiphon pisum TaxID=7029 RepID=A0A8R2F8N4_ACYPI|nr:short transient receptor potential channel 6-like [Acyrthosiphon pisum]|eukprot:XP_008183081.1 PREDICTED: short transient receptor potential channel 6-like [Acyrthosiphon pisum]